MSPTQHDCPQTAEVPHSRDTRPHFSSEQIAKYIAHIGLPKEFAESPILRDKSLTQQEEYAVPFLGALMRYHLARIPFENLDLHYTQGRVMTLDVEQLYENMVSSGRGRGGYCFQQNIFFSTVLRSMGFDVMTTAARVNTACGPGARAPNYKGPSYNPWNHMANIVTIGSKDWLIDVGMNAWGPVVPIEVKKTEVVSISPRTCRLTYGCIAEYTSRRDSNRVWNFEVRNGDGQAWVPTYCFAMLEFTPADFAALNWYVSTNKASFFTQMVLCGRLLLADDGASVVGDETLFGSTLLKRVHGEVVEQVECKSEEERFALLKERFGITLASYERDAILGTGAQIP